MNEQMVGAVLVFKSDDVERVQEFLNRLVERDIIQPATAREFNPQYGGPVWYIP